MGQLRKRRGQLRVGRVRPWSQILRYSNSGGRPSGLRRAYAQYREDNSLPQRCDNPVCRFHTKRLVWNGKRLAPIVDHIDGDRCDNSPHNLRYLCPNCDSQLGTRGGKNRGRVTGRTDDGSTVNNDDGTRIVKATGRA